ncbi:hypothetical protein T439DRAFT_29940 [Meredithblackwellia eburnea MCA 4105]
MPSTRPSPSAVESGWTASLRSISNWSRVVSVVFLAFLPSSTARWQAISGESGSSRPRKASTSSLQLAQQGGLPPITSQLKRNSKNTLPRGRSSQQLGGFSGPRRRSTGTRSSCWPTPLGSASRRTDESCTSHTSSVLAPALGSLKLGTGASPFPTSRPRHLESQTAKLATHTET